MRTRNQRPLMKIYLIDVKYSFVREDPVQDVGSPEKIAQYMRGAFDEHPDQEQLWVISLDRKNHPKGRTLVTLGTATGSLVHPREVFRPAIIAGASAIVVCHNHPSGDPAPSSADVAVTRKLREAAVAIDIELLDHVIIGDKVADPMGRGFYSFREAGLL